jgi:hypothetical protein
MIFLLGCFAIAALAEDASAIKFLSPDGRFGLRVADLKVDLIETGSGKVMLDLASLWIDRDTNTDREEPRLVWSDDSKWVAYGTRTSASGSTAVYLWDGSIFKKLALPAKLPELKIKPREGDSDVKLEGYVDEPLNGYIRENSSCPASSWELDGTSAFVTRDRLSSPLRLIRVVAPP